MTILKLRNSVCEIKKKKKITGWLNSISDTAEERISEFETGQ